MGNLATTEKEEAVTVDTDSSESELSMSSDNEDDDESICKLPYQAHRLSHMLAKVIDGKPQTSGLATLPNDYELKTLPQELQKDKEAQSLANAMQGCLIRKCLFRDGKGGIFVCSQGQARVEGSIFRYLTYAMRCAENSKIVMLKNDIHHCKTSGIFLRLGAGGLIAENNIHSNCEASVDIRKGANPLITKNRIHSLRGHGIEILDVTKALVQDNLIFQGKTKKSILQQGSKTEGCVVGNNKVLAFRKRADNAWTLENPPARPHIEGSSRGMSTSGNSQKGSNVTARIAARVDGGCHNNSSIFCAIL
ncbi:hypothetical protein JRQ81_013177 [Phrynocephalus forsythii]|uniref:Right handed beta helix domain-containing protein n=1 Tax=Phrynocephalus forsythii TaxID=171643 RepID=A0A9Q1B4I1_9SAUR|nr:hypothetical protein JRQ81_013177 [Phrynocephalus forsythii]